MKCRNCKGEMSNFTVMNNDISKFRWYGYVCLKCLKFTYLNYSEETKSFTLIEENIKFREN